MTYEEILAIKKIVEGCNTLTSAWDCGPVKMNINYSAEHWSAIIICPTNYYAIYIASFLALVCSHLPCVNENKITFE